MKNQKHRAKRIIWLLALGMFMLSANLNASQPNIIFLVTDDHGYNDLEATDLHNEVDMPNMHRSTYSLAETFDIGIDTGTQVSKLYKGTNKFTGELDRVVIRSALFNRFD